MDADTTQPKTHTIDATGKKLGRLASEIALLLRGKDTPDFERHIAPSVRVVVENVSKMSIDARKFDNKVYTRYTGYPGGLRSDTLGKTVEGKGYAEALKRAVYGMLPSNKLRARIMKHLVMSE